MPHSEEHDQKRRKQTSLDYSNAESSDGFQRTTSNVTAESDQGKTAPWRALFFFTTRANLPVVLAGIVASIIGGAVNPAQAWVMGRLFNGLTAYATPAVDKEEFLNKQKTNVFYLLAISGGSWLFLFFEFAAWLAFGELQAKSARDRLFRGLLDKDIEWYDMRKSGIAALLPRIQAQIRELQLATAQPLGALVQLSSTAILSLVQAMVHSWDLTLVTLATVPLVMLAVVLAGRGIQQNLDKNQSELTEAQKYSTGAFAAIETVKCFNGQQVEQVKYIQAIGKAATWYYRVASANAVQMALIVLLSVSMFVQGFYYGGILVAEHKKTTADIMTTFLSAIGAFQAVTGVLPQLIVLEKGRNAGSTLRSIMAQISERSGSPRPTSYLQPTSCVGNIELKNVSFAYPSRPQQPALSNVSLFISSGDVTFLVGRSGSGKSTIAQLLMRFYSPSRGDILMDGVDLNAIDVHWLRTNITLVEQTSLLFNDTIFRNIAFGKTDYGSVTKEEVVTAIEFALLQLMIYEMPNGLDTNVGYKGGALSGGQRQRMALARARLRNTPILILDESTSALDHITRALMMDAIRHWRRGMTTIIVTHDTSQILPDDYVCILEQGSLVQEGFRKHIEKIKDAPFQTFIPDSQRVADSPFDARKGIAFESVRTHGSSLDDTIDNISRLSDDPLEIHLQAGENKRSSFLPRVFKDGSPLPGMRAAPLQGPSSAFASPWTRFAASTPSKSPPGLNPDARSAFSKPKEETESPKANKAGKGGKRWSAALENLMNRTGNLAVNARTSKIKGTRRPVDPAQAELEASRKEGGSSRRLSSSTEKTELVSGNDRRSLKQIMSTLWRSIDWKSRTLLLLGFWAATTHAVSTPAFSYVLSKLLQLYSVPGGNKPKSLVYSMSILGIAVVDATHTYMFRFFLEYVGQKWIDSVRSEAMRRILDQPRAFFDSEENSISRLASSLDRSAEEMRNLLGRFLGLIWIAALVCAVSITWALITQWKMTLIALCAAPYIFAATKAFAVVSERWESLSNDAGEEAAAIFAETFTNIKTVRALTLEQHFLDKYIKATNKALMVGFQRSFYAGFFFGLSDSGGNFAIAMIFYVGASLVKSGVSVPDIVQVFTMLIFTITNVSATLEFIPQIGSSIDTASRLLRLAQLPEDSHEHFGDTRIASVGDIVFDDLEFCYPSRPEQTVLKHINLHIQSGTSTAIVGGSGSGKSTVANLLLNLYCTPAPAVRDRTMRWRRDDLMLAGRDINQIYTPSLRSLVTTVSQSPTLFPATVAENIVYGLPHNSAYNSATGIQTAASRSGIHDFINSLPQGYSTPIGEGGMGLSGGQAQRIAIARALVRNPAVLILDEATSALDMENANLIRQTLSDLLEHDRQKEHKQGHGLTVIIITHSRDMMEMAENIVVLDQGRIVEEGPFEELVARSGGPLANLLSGGEWVDERGRVATDGPRRVPLTKDVNWRKQRKTNTQRFG